MKKQVVLVLALVMSLLLAGVAYADGHLIAAANDYFSGGTKNISAADLYDNLNDGDTDNDPFILSVRSADDYALGHIKGAVRMDFTTVFTADGLAQLPMDKQVVVYCYTGQNASWVTSGLRMLGYDAYNLLFGMSGWSANPEVYHHRFDPATVPDYPTTTEATVATETYAAPAPLADTMAGALDANFSGGPKYIKATDLYDNLNDGDTSNDPFVISVRSAEDYAKGHIKGAVHMDFKTMWNAETLATIPGDRQVVVYCYTGQSSAQVSTALRVLGYDAWSMSYGLQSWSADPAVYVKRFNPDTVPDYPTEGTAGETAAAPATLPTTGAAIPVDAMTLGLSLFGAASVLAGGVAIRRKK